MTGPGSTLDAIGAGKYVSITTFKKDGTTVATPTWVARDGDRLVVWTQADSGKVKRIRNSPRVLLAPCDQRGRTSAEPAEGTATILDAAGTAEVESIMATKFGRTFGFFRWLGRRRAKAGHVGLELRVG